MLDGLFKKWFGGKQDAADKHDLSQGYTPEYMRSRARELRALLTDLKKHVEVIVDKDADPEGLVGRNCRGACNNIELVLQSLKRDPADLQVMGLQLEAIPGIVEMAEETAHLCAMGSKKDALKAAARLAETFEKTAKAFHQLREGKLQADNVFTVQKNSYATDDRLNS